MDLSRKISRLERRLNVGQAWVPPDLVEGPIEADDPNDPECVREEVARLEQNLAEIDSGRYDSSMRQLWAEWLDDARKRLAEVEAGPQEQSDGQR